MLFLGWIFLIPGIIAAFFLPPAGIISIIIGVLLLGLARKRKHGKYRYLEEKYRLKAKRNPDNAQKYLDKADKYKVKAAKYEA